MDLVSVLERCKALGITLTPVGNKLRMYPFSAIPPDLVEELRKNKAQIISLLRKVDFNSWVLEEWRRVSIPEWRRILQESIDKKDQKREEYARWMLREILLDPEY